MTGYSISAGAQVNGMVLLRFKGPGGFSLAFEMAPEEALRLAGDITRMVHTTPASAARANPITDRVERRGA